MPEFNLKSLMTNSTFSIRLRISIFSFSFHLSRDATPFVISVDANCRRGCLLTWDRFILECFYICYICCTNTDAATRITSHVAHTEDFTLDVGWSKGNHNITKQAIIAEAGKYGCAITQSNAPNRKVRLVDLGQERIVNRFMVAGLHFWDRSAHKIFAL